MTERGYSVSTAVDRLFKIQLQRHEGFRNIVNTLVRSFDLAEHELQGSASGRRRRLIPPGNLTKLHNAVILHGCLGNPKRVKKIFVDSNYRRNTAADLTLLLKNKSLIGGIQLDPPRVDAFLSMLSQIPDLTLDKLPNPFITLPQLHTQGPIGLIDAAHADIALLDLGDQIVVHYVYGDLKSAADAATRLNIDNPHLQQLCDKIKRECREAEEFQQLLESIRPKNTC